MLGLIQLDDQTGRWDSALIATAGDSLGDLPDGEEVLERFQVAVDLMLELGCDEIVLTLT